MTTQTVDILDQITNNLTVVSELADAQQRFDQNVAREIELLWQAVSELRDELHTLATSRNETYPSL